MLIEEVVEISPVNLFVGAGISKLPPAYAPIWREMQIEFCEALYSKMKAEKWDVFHVDNEIEALRNFNFRPETFWERILENTSIEFVTSALGIVNIGQPNLNHLVIGELCQQGVVNNIITTNFDEYLEKTIPSGYTHIFEESSNVSSDAQKQYFKIHGTLSSETSMQFTLKHTKLLPKWKEDMLERSLKKYPLVIAGYSGWDDDIMPTLMKLAQDIPQIILVRYPGSSADEPVLNLAKLSQTKLIETDFSAEARFWANKHATEKIKDAEDASKSPAMTEADLKDFYKITIDKLNVPFVPFLVSIIFELAGNRELTMKYAWLTDDACDDDRYKDQLTNDFKGKAETYLASMLAPRDPRWAQSMMRHAQENYPHDASPVANSTMDNIYRVFGYFLYGELTPRQEAEIEQHAMSALKLLEVGAIGGEGISFMAGWCMGRLRSRQGRLKESVYYYTQAVKELSGISDDVQKGSFLLDCGLAVMKLSVEEQSDQALLTAIGILEQSESIAVNISDHQTAAKAMMNLSNCYAITRESDRAIQKVKDAQRLARLTGDFGLQSRAMNLEAQIIDLISTLRKADMS